MRRNADVDCSSRASAPLRTCDRREGAGRMEPELFSTYRRAQSRRWSKKAEILKIYRFRKRAKLWLDPKGLSARITRRGCFQCGLATPARVSRSRGKTALAHRLWPTAAVLYVRRKRVLEDSGSCREGQ